jgi:hypothetical protein
MMAQAMRRASMRARAGRPLRDSRLGQERRPRERLWGSLRRTVAVTSAPLAAIVARDQQHGWADATGAEPPRCPTSEVATGGGGENHQAIGACQFARAITAGDICYREENTSAAPVARARRRRGTRRRHMGWGEGKDAVSWSVVCRVPNLARRGCPPLCPLRQIWG